jgi:hypothetical protein
MAGEKEPPKSNWRVFATYILTSGLATWVVGVLAMEVVAVIGCVLVVVAAVTTIYLAKKWPDVAVKESPILDQYGRNIQHPVFQGYLVKYAWIAIVAVLLVTVHPNCSRGAASPAR